jgi:hypothetical protein
MMGENSIIDIRSKQIDLRPIDKKKVVADKLIEILTYKVTKVLRNG